MIRLTIPGTPVAKGTGKIDARGKFARLVPNQKTVNFENLVKLCASELNAEPIEGPIRVHIEAYWPMKGQPLKNGYRPRMPKATKPDADNLSKSVLDGMEGVLFPHDAAVVDLRVLKWHSAQGEMPRTEVVIEAVK